MTSVSEIRLLQFSRQTNHSQGSTRYDNIVGDNWFCIGSHKWYRTNATTKTFACLQTILCVAGFAVLGEARRSALRANCRVQLHGQ